MDPKHGDAHFVSAKLALGEKDAQRAVQHLDTMRASGKDGYVVQSLLGEIAEHKDDKVRMRFHLEAAHRLDPSQADPLKGLYDLAHEAKAEGDELELLRKLAQLEQHDKKVWRLLLEKLVAKKDWEQARRVGESAVFVDVAGGPTHILYARALGALGAHEKALFELESALLTKLKDPEKASAHAVMARSLTALKRPDAQKHLDEAKKLDPENADLKSP
jgi:cellulose synthase operon protein C